MSETSTREKEIFAEALVLPVAERDDFIAGACGCDDTMRGRLAALLQAHVAADEFLMTPPQGGLARTCRESSDDRIGRYRLVHPIGEGGCGTVFLAEQEEPVRRQVALKLIKPGPVTRTVIARFETERQALASMEHPNIARIFDAGSTDDGRPFFVMELVRGARLTAYCDEHRLPLCDRIALFVPVCHAVHHAHGRGVIHRDLKPANILVTVHDSAPVPKVIDFGIAKTIPPPGTRDEETTPPTPTHAVLGTLNYLSPEQAGQVDQPVDRRSDIYSLGVLLYELITGCTPYAVSGSKPVSLEELRCRMREGNLTCPSQRLAAFAPDRLRRRAADRRRTPEELLREVRGGLDEITMHCLERNPGQRYPTAAALAADLVRYVQSGPDPRPTPKLARVIRWFAPRSSSVPIRVPQPRVPTENQAAFAAYLRGRRLADRSYNREDLEGAVAAFEEATTLDPRFALAWAHLSMAHAAMYWFTCRDPTTTRLACCKAAVDEALRLQPDLPEAHLTLGVYHYRGFRDWENAQRELEIARESLPNDAGVWCHLALNERRLGRWVESTEHFEQAVALDPRNTTAWAGLIDNHAFHRRHREAVAAGARALAVAPNDRMVHHAHCWSRFALDGDGTTLFAGLAQCVAAPPDDARDRAELALWRGDFDDAAHILAASQALSFRDHRRETARAELQALAAHLRGDHASARSFAETAAGFYGASMLHREPEEAFNLVSLGRALALQGRAGDALDYGRRAMARLPVTRDALWGTEIIGEHAALCLLAGAPDEAVHHLTALLHQPYDTSVHELRLHPLWRKLAGDPRFDTLLETIAPLPDAPCDGRAS